jgi:hypothetical protein
VPLEPFRFLADLDLPERRAIQEDARYMGLQGRVISAQAQDLVQHLMDDCVAPFVEHQGKSLRPTSRQSCSLAVGAIITDLVAAMQHGQAAARSIRNESFTPPCPVGRTAFERAMGGLQAAGFVDVRLGHNVKGRGSIVATRSVPTLYRPTPAFLELVDRFEIKADQPLSAHFDLGKRDAADNANVLVARTKVVRDEEGHKLDPEDVVIDPADEVASAIRGRMERLNNFLLQPGRVEGFSFGGLRRIFSNADQEGFRWQWGGRMYTLPGWDQYERWKDGYETRRKIIQLDGETIAEVDVSAAFLTILYGLLGEPFDPSEDPYAVAKSIKRERAKRWCTIVLGTFDLATGGTRFAPVRSAFLQRHPLLEKLPSCGMTNADLQYHESEIILAALEAMRDKYGVTSLPIHDCLAVPVSKVELAREELLAAFQVHFREVVGSTSPIYPRVSIKGLAA